MRKTVLQDGDEGVQLIVRDRKPKRSKKSTKAETPLRSPVHVVYGGADRFGAETPAKLGRIASATLEIYAPNKNSFGAIFGLKGEAASVFDRVKAKLTSEPVEDFRIDFEDGYGFRTDSEEDADAMRAARELAASVKTASITAFSGFRVKSYSAETRDRAKRTLNIFLGSLLESTSRKLPSNFVVTLPKVTDKKEVSALCRDLKKIEKEHKLKEGSVKIEIMVEHPLALIDRKGNFALRVIVEAARGRCVAAHFGAYDYTASLGIAASHQDIAHPACDFARHVMLASLSPLGIRLSDSVTTQMPVPLHKGEKINAKQKSENRTAIAAGLQIHFQNVTRSMSNGFYQSWDLHPNHLIARYAAVFTFFLEAMEAQAVRLRAFIDKATQATLTGNAFDDAATAMGIMNFFRQGLACGALSEDEIEKATGLTAAALKQSSFSEISESGRSR
ncbi:MAG: phosphoenolpyruvate kinase [Acidobacteria bacterium]|nr:phosphoenolpyruvate kinase [Acidobacteriota bacterium]